MPAHIDHVVHAAGDRVVAPLVAPAAIAREVQALRMRSPASELPCIVSMIPSLLICTHGGTVNPTGPAHALPWSQKCLAMRECSPVIDVNAVAVKNWMHERRPMPGMRRSRSAGNDRGRP